MVARTPKLDPDPVVAERIWRAIVAEVRDVKLTSWAQAKTLVAERRLQNKVIARSGTGKNRFFRLYTGIERLYEPTVDDDRQAEERPA